MKRLLITFSGAPWNVQTGKTVERAAGFGADEIKVYDDVWLNGTEFFKSDEFQWLFNHKGRGNERGKRGYGYFSWKPYIIRHALDNFCEDGDIVLYIDGDTFPIADFSVLYDECARIGGIMAFMATAKEGPLRNGDWNKRDCMICMGMDQPEFTDAGTAVARFMLFQKGVPLVDEFLAEWQKHCLCRNCQTFEHSKLAPEYPGLREHRTEQAVYTNLCHRYGLKLYREACGFGKDCLQDWDLYPQLFEQVDPGRPKSYEGSRYRNV